MNYESTAVKVGEIKKHAGSLRTINHWLALLSKIEKKAEKLRSESLVQ